MLRSSILRMDTPSIVEATANHALCINRQQAKEKKRNAVGNYPFENGESQAGGII